MLIRHWYCLGLEVGVCSKGDDHWGHWAIMWCVRLSRWHCTGQASMSRAVQCVSGKQLLPHLGP